MARYPDPPRAPVLVPKPGTHNAVRVRVRNVAMMRRFLAQVPGCEHCGAPLDTFVPFFGDEPEPVTGRGGAGGASGTSCGVSSGGVGGAGGGGLPS